MVTHATPLACNRSRLTSEAQSSEGHEIPIYSCMYNYMLGDSKVDF